MKDYYTNKEIKTYAMRSLMIAIAGLGTACVALGFVIFKVIKFENKNAEPYWQTYEVVYKDPTQVILYNQDNRKDSIVMKGSPRLYPGIQAVEILKYKIK